MMTGDSHDDSKSRQSLPFLVARRGAAQGLSEAADLSFQSLSSNGTAFLKGRDVLIVRHGEGPLPSDIYAVSVEAFEPDPPARARLRGRWIAEGDLKRAGGAYTEAEVGIILGGLTDSDLSDLIVSNRLLAVPGPDRRPRFPTCQFTDTAVVPGLDAVLSATPQRDPWAILNFLVTPDEALSGRTPIAALHAGEGGEVARLAAMAGSQGDQ